MSEISDVFFLDSGIAARLHDACDVLHAELQAMIVKAIELGTIDAFGTLVSGQALQTKFEQKAVGGPDALLDVLKSHVEAVKSMQAQFQACIDNALDQESSNVSTLRSIDQPN